MPSLLLYQPVYNYALDKNVQGVQVAPMIDGSQRFSTVSSWYIATQRMLFSEARNERSMCARAECRVWPRTRLDRSRRRWYSGFCSAEVAEPADAPRSGRGGY